jgi:quercetin dioxygenase-like cupin family protein
MEKWRQGMTSDTPILVVEPGEGLHWNVGGRLVCKVGSDQTGGAFTVLELSLPPGGGPPLHVHRREDEIFYVVEGECTVGSEEQSWTLRPGATAVFPKGRAHFFRNESDAGSRVLITAVPGGLDRYFHEIDAALAAGRPEAVPGINQKYEIEFFPTAGPREAGA